jgi:hypothetical protein
LESASPESGNPPAPPYKETPQKGNPKREARLAAIKAVYDAWKADTGRNGTTKLTDDRRTKINARLDDGYTVDQLVTVVTAGWRADPWKERVSQNDLTILLRSGSQVEKFLELAAGNQAKARHLTALKADASDRLPFGASYTPDQAAAILGGTG